MSLVTTQRHTAPRKSYRTEGAHDSGLSRVALALLYTLPAVLLSVMFPILFMACFTRASFVATLLSAVVVAVGLSLAGRLVRPVRDNMVTVLSFFVLGVVVVCTLVPDARMGMFSFYNALIVHFDDAFGAYVGEFSNGGTVSSGIVFGVLCGSLAGVLGWMSSRQRKVVVPLLLVVFACSFSMVLSLGPTLLGVVLGLSAWIIMARFIQLSSAAYSSSLLVIDSVLFIASCAVVVQLVALLYVPLPAIDAFHDGTVAAFEELRYGHDSLPEGDLSNASSMNEGEGEGLSLRIDGDPSSDLLLKGFVGASFEDGSWSKLGHAAYEGEWRGLFGWLSDQGFVPAKQRSEYDDALNEAKSTGTPEVLTVYVDASKANRRYVYAPYSLRSVAGINPQFDLDGSLDTGLLGSDMYRLGVDDVARTEALSDASWLEGAKGSFRDAEGVYAAFVEENYLSVSDEEAVAAKRLLFDSATWDSSADSSRQAVISRVRTMLSAHAGYTTAPAEPAERGSFLEWFLTRAHEGNSSYFATAATLALRSQGIPARYVEGYLAKQDSLETLDEGEVLNLTAKDAHAWVEVYFAGYGWTPVEVTPGFYKQNVNADKVIDIKESNGRGSGDSAVTNEPVSGAIQGTWQDESSNSPSFGQFLLTVVLVVGAVGLALLVLAVLQRFVRRQRRARLIASDDQQVSLLALYDYLSVILREADRSFDPSRPLDVLDRIDECFEGVDSCEYRRVVELHETFAFGARPLHPHELRAVRAYTARLHEGLPEPRSVMGRLRRYFVCAL